MKKFLTIFTLTSLVILLIIASFYIYYTAKRVEYNRTITGAVKSDITITRNSQGIPKIQAGSREDMFFGMGYIHAQDRMLLLEYYRSIANANLTELIGKEAEVLDRIVKVSGITKKAHEIAGDIKSPYLEYLEAYAKGINLIKTKQRIKKAERKWVIEDIISILLLREWTNAFNSNMENIFQFQTDVKKKYILSRAIPGKLLYYYNRDDESCISIIRNIKSILYKYIGTYNRGLSYYIPGGKTGKGAPYSAYSFRSSLNVYPVHYPVHIDLGDVKIKGITLAGLPFIYAGNNNKITFFGMSLDVDTQDFIIEDFKKVKGTSYFRGKRGWEKLKFIRMPVIYKNYEKSQEIIWATENGPVLNEIYPDINSHSKIVTMKTIYPDKGYISSLFDIPFSESIEKATGNVKKIISFPRVYMFNDQNGSVRVYSGKIPVRNKSQRVFRNRLFSWNGIFDLSGYITRSKKEIFASSSYSAGLPVIARINSLSDSSSSKRLKFLLNEKEKFNSGDIMNILTDRYSENANILTGKFLPILGKDITTSVRLTRIYLREWNKHMDPDKVAPSIYTVLLRNFIVETYKDEFTDILKNKTTVENVFLNYTYMVDNFKILINNLKSPLFDNIDTKNIETAEGTFDRAFIKSIRSLNRRKGPVMDHWKWGDVLSYVYKIPVKKSPLLDKYVYKKQAGKFRGSPGTLVYGKYNSSLEPVEDTSLYGFFGNKESKIFMNFSYSTHSMSQFYYGKSSKYSLINFEKLKSNYITRIQPQ